MELHIGEHKIANIFGFDVHIDTLLTLWLSMGVILFLAVLAVSKINILPSKIQGVFEKIVLIFVGLTENLGKEQGTAALVLMSLFLLIITGNLMGQVPFKILNLKGFELASPTNDINVTLALALFVLVYYILKGIKSKGIGYFKHYFQPVWFMAPFNLLEDFTRPLTLTIRLFANILSGELIIILLGSIVALIISPNSPYYGAGTFLGSFLPLPLMFYELFVAFIQALVFTLLANAYIQLAVEKSH